MWTNDEEADAALDALMSKRDQAEADGDLDAADAAVWDAATLAVDYMLNQTGKP